MERLAVLRYLRYFRDGGQGNTQNSVRFFFRAAEKIVRWNNSSARPVRVVINSNGFNTPNKRAPFTMRIEYASDFHTEDRYVILLSGVQAGYGGEGPHGSATILRSMGMPEKLLENVFKMQFLDFEWKDEWKDEWRLADVGT